MNHFIVKQKRLIQQN